MMLPVVFVVAALWAPQDPQASPAPAEPEVKQAAAQPDEASAFIAAGLRAFRVRRYGQAEIEFRKAMEADPQSAAAAFYLAYTYYKMVEPKRPFHPGKAKAADLFARAFELDPAFKPAWTSKH